MITSSTEELANVLAGVATSCTGERCFGHGTLRQQIIALKMMNHCGQLQELKAEEQLCDSSLLEIPKGGPFSMSIRRATRSMKVLRMLLFLGWKWKLI